MEVSSSLYTWSQVSAEASCRCYVWELPLPVIHSCSIVRLLLVNRSHKTTRSESFFWPRLKWAAADLSEEWKRFYEHCEFTFGGPLSKCTEKEKISNLMSFVGNRGREVYLTFKSDLEKVHKML